MATEIIITTNGKFSFSFKSTRELTEKEVKKQISENVFPREGQTHLITLNGQYYGTR